MSEAIEFARHPESEIFPRMSAEEYQALVKSMKDHGFDPAFPIVLFENAIIDGWHRYQAANEAGVKPVTRAWRGKATGIRDFVIYANSTRRHMSKAAHAQALVRANLGRAEKDRLNTKAIARSAGVSVALVNTQERLRANDPETADKVADGTMPSSVAVRKVLKQTDDPQTDRRPYWLTQKLTKEVMQWSLESGETFDKFCQKAITDRVAKAKAKAGTAAKGRG